MSQVKRRRPVHDTGKTVAANMRRFRKQRGWTQEELGERLGWHKGIVSAAERSAQPNVGRVRAFDIDDVVLLAGTLGVTVMDLITPEPPCSCCKDSPPAGMTCQECKVSGPVFDAGKAITGGCPR